MKFRLIGDPTAVVLQDGFATLSTTVPTSSIGQGVLI